MLSTCVSSLARRASTRQQTAVAAKFAKRTMVTPTLGEARDTTADCAWKKSCYSGIDYTIGDDSPVLDAVEKFAAYNVGCLVTTDASGKLFLHFDYLLECDVFHL